MRVIDSIGAGVLVWGSSSPSRSTPHGLPRGDEITTGQCISLFPSPRWCRSTTHSLFCLSSCFFYFLKQCVSRLMQIKNLYIAVLLLEQILMGMVILHWIMNTHGVLEHCCFF